MGKKKNQGRLAPWERNLNKEQKQAAKALGINNVNKVAELERINNYISAAQQSKSDPVYQQAAQNIGITNYNSVNDYAQVVRQMTNTPAPAASSGNSGGGGSSSPANDGSYDNIRAIYEQQMAEARAREQEYAQKAADQIQAIQLDMSAQMAAAQQAADQQMGYLNDLMMQQAEETRRTQDMLGQQLSAAQAAYSEQARAAAALGRAFVPALEPTAATVQMGDQRKTEREDTNNTLSALAITSSIGANSNPLAGLQLA